MTGAMDYLDARGFVPADFDRDGDIDFFLTNNSQPCVYLENIHGQKRNWCTVQPRGAGKTNGGDNRFGIGARVYLTAGGRTQMREIHAGAGYLSSPPPEAHFGLGDHGAIEQIRVRWPNGTETVVLNPGINQVLTIQQPGPPSIQPQPSR